MKAYPLPALLTVLALGGCQDTSDGRRSAAGIARGETATWDIDPTSAPSADARNIDVLVSRLGCASGRTGTVLEPVVQEQPGQVVITFTVEALPREEGADFLCLGNPPVAQTVVLSTPLGDRTLVDGSCLSGEAASAGPCVSGPTRWPAAGAAGS